MSEHRQSCRVIWSNQVLASVALPDQAAAPRVSCDALIDSAPVLSALPWPECDTHAVHIAWDRLAAHASEPNPFYERWYLLPSLHALDPDGSVQLLRLEVNGALAGLLPIKREARYYRRPIPHWRGWAHDNCFLGAPLVEAGKETAFWRAVLGWADQQGGPGLFLHLAHLPLDGPLHTALTSVLAEQQRLGALVHREDRAMLRSELSPEAYLDHSLSGKKRKELRRQFARLSELGPVRFTRQEGPTGIGGWIDEFLALEHSGWKGSVGSALSSHFATEALFRDAIAGAAQAGKLERITLWLDEAPIAMLINFLTPPGAFSYKTAFDERYARFSPGVLLQRENLELLHRTEITWCDSCAAADHPMIDHLWRERRAIGRVSLAIGSPLRRKAFGLLARAELGRNPTGLCA
jgi:CelD/BcsL family acetyltransferase involved in cellulose biosynthesis